MPKPQAYAPEKGYKYQILVMTPYSREYEHCDYAENGAEKKSLLENYRLAYGAGFSFKTILLPAKYWPKKKEKPLGEFYHDLDNGDWHVFHTEGSKSYAYFSTEKEAKEDAEERNRRREGV